VSGEVWSKKFLQNTVDCQAYEEVPIHVAALSKNSDESLLQTEALFVMHIILKELRPVA
jgi:hypothetical protein